MGKAVAASLPSGGPGGPPDPAQLPLPAARPDLMVSPQLYLGKTVYVVKDPVSLTYFRLKPQEHFIFRQMDGQANAEDLAQRATRKFADQPVTADMVLKFSAMMQGAGLVLGRDVGHAPRLRQLQKRKRQLRKRAKLFNFLFIKVSLLDPDRMLHALYRMVGWTMNRATMTLALLFLAVSAIAAGVGLWRVDELAFPILSPINLAMLTGLFFATKVIHEFGHGLAAKHYKLEVHEMGVLFMVFWPMFYVDVSDAWMLPRKSERNWINAGGMFIEMLLASVAAWVWLLTEPGWVNQAAFNTMLAGSITTVLFNANPLLRYDGYYILMDWMEIPNLRTKASQYITYLMHRYVLAAKTQLPPLETRQRPVFMICFSIASTIYRWVVVIGIVGIVWHVLDGYGLEVVGTMLGFFSLTTMILMPIAKMLKSVWQVQAATPRRLAVSLVVLIAVVSAIVGILMLPTEQVVDRPVVVMAKQQQPLFIPVSGKVEQVFYKAGQVVEAGEPLLQLSDPALIDHRDTLRIERQEIELALNQARTRGRNDAIASGLLQLERIDKRLTWLEDRVDKLTVRAPFRGKLLSAQRLSTMIGIKVERGQQLGNMIGEGEKQILAVLPQSEAGLLRVGLDAQIRLWTSPQQQIHGRVWRIDRRILSELPHEALASVYGGEVDTVLTNAYNTAPSQPSVLARIQLNDDAITGDVFPLLDGMTGWSRIVIGRSTLGWQQYRKLRQAISLDWWL